ncbi:HAAS signaling domain-containing protein [Gemmiger sp.]|uniref:HAAS signaling domain-containing protein n=1 Tax=Gemmiger sp. TaxID=2049027 RepID=UPI003AB2A9FF
MNKQTYLAKLAQLLAPLPEQERQDALNYYEEYFDAAGPEAEDATAAELGDPADAARKILEGEGLMLDSAQAAAGESSDAADTAQDAAPEPTGENPPTTKPELHGPAAIPPVMGVLLALAAVLVVVCVLLIGFFGVRRSSIADTAETFVVSAVEQSQDADPTTETPDSENVEESGTAAEGSSDPVDDNNPHTMGMSFGSITPQDAVLDIDYGRLTIVIDPGATSVALHCENIYSKRFDFTYTENEPLTIRYKVPANCDLSSEPEPEFVLSVPDAETFHFKKLSITSAMGDVEFDNSDTIAADSIDIDLAMGSFTGSTVQAEQFTANISMGDFDLGLLAGVETAKVEAAMGDIGLTVDGRPNDYALDLQTSMGNVVFNGRTMSSIYTQTAAAPRSVTLTASMGDVVLTTTQ